MTATDDDAVDAAAASWFPRVFEWDDHLTRCQEDDGSAVWGFGPGCLSCCCLTIASEERETWTAGGLAGDILTDVAV